MANTAKIEDMFRKYDKNGDGKMSRDEFKALFRAIDGSTWDEQKADRLFNAADSDKSNSLSIQEFLNWVFGKAQGRTFAKAYDASEKATKVPPRRSKSAVSAAGGAAGDEDSSSSSSSSSESSGDEGGGRATSKKSPAKRRKKKAPGLKPVISNQDFYELVTGFAEGSGQVGARLGIGAFASLLARLRRGGFGEALGRLVPQDAPHLPAGRECEEISPYELAHLYVLIHNSEALQKGTAEERLAAGLRVVDEQRERCRHLDYERESDLQTVVDVDPKGRVGFGEFVALARLSADLMRLDLDHFLSGLLWAQCDCFEMPIAMASRVMEALFLRVPKKGETVLQQHIKSNDFMRMCHVQQLADNDGKAGIPHAQLSLMFASTLQALPRLLGERDKMRKLKRGAKEDKKHHNHKSICGRVKLSILFDQLYKAMPAGLYTSPFHMVLSLLEVADAVNAQSQPS